MIDMLTSLPLIPLMLLILTGLLGTVAAGAFTGILFGEVSAWQTLASAIAAIAMFSMLMVSITAMSDKLEAEAETALSSYSSKVKSICGSDAAHDFRYTGERLDAGEEDLKDLFVDFVADPQQCPR